VSYTIFALSSGALPSGVAIVRLSGPGAWAIATSLIGCEPALGALLLKHLKNPLSGDIIDQALVAGFKQPNSFTGEDVVELHCHGSRATIAALFNVLEQQEDCRLAEAGEFSRRAFLNGKMDLTEVEGLSDLIAAETELQRKLALRQSGGALREIYEDWRSMLIRSRALIEAELDFADEDDVPGGISSQVWDAVAGLEKSISAHLDDGNRGEIVRDGFRIALLGPPNAGKSSLLNALAKRDVAIVTPLAGTTRDTIDVSLDLSGAKVVFTDTAGIRDSDDVIEKVGMERAIRAAEKADLIFWLQPLGEVSNSKKPDTAVSVWTKSDLMPDVLSNDLLTINTVGENGIDSLLTFLDDQLSNLHSGLDQPLVSRHRHRVVLEQVVCLLSQALQTDLALEIRSDCLRQAGDCLGRVTGRVDVEDLLDVIFSEFCVGK